MPILLTPNTINLSHKKIKHFSLTNIDYSSNVQRISSILMTSLMFLKILPNPVSSETLLFDLRPRNISGDILFNLHSLPLARSLRRVNA